MADDDYVPPPRSLLWANPYVGENGEKGIELGCDCGTDTILIITDVGQITEPQEIAVTCKGCNSVRWITVGPVDQLRQEEAGDGR